MLKKRQIYRNKVFTNHINIYRTICYKKWQNVNKICYSQKWALTISEINNERIWSKCTWDKVSTNTWQNQAMEQCFHCCSSSWSHHEAFNNELCSYLVVSSRRPLAELIKICCKRWQMYRKKTRIYKSH